MPNPPIKETIIGAGIIGAMEAYYAYLQAKESNQQVRITIYDKNENLAQTTAANIVPSLTPDEILSVVPRGPLLVEKLGILFSQPGGIRVDDVNDVNDSVSAERFKSEVRKDSEDEHAHKRRTDTLLRMGKESMQEWQKIYESADAELKKIFEEANFNPCREPTKAQSTLHDGYRIDLIYNVAGAKEKAQAMQNDYQSLGYQSCKILTPAQVNAMDPFLGEFCDSHSTLTNSGERVWNNDAVALYRPGGCLDTEVFLPKFYAYLKKMMGQYTNEAGVKKDCLQLKFNRNIHGAVYDAAQPEAIKGLNYNDNRVKVNKHAYNSSEYVFCPGEAVGTLKKLGFNEPAYAGFAGASLKLNIPIPADKLAQYSTFNHCMEVHQEGVVLAWQARFKDNQIFMGVAGTKAFYGDKQPHKDQAFAMNRNLLQLNMINEVLPEFISLALQRNTKGQKLTQNDLTFLESKGIAKRWVGTRAVAYDGFPTLGPVYNERGRVTNARCTTHLGSGGVSFAPAAVLFSRKAARNRSEPDPLLANVTSSADIRRRARA